MLFLRWAWPGMVLIRSPLTFLGMVPLVSGFGIMIVGWSQFRASGANINTFAQPNRLVTGGIFRFSRNPMYLGFALILAGAWVFLGGLSPILGVLLFVAITERWYIAFEEQAMRDRFGLAYESYQHKTRRWI
jgi:protein-S-isoprenylcysteine O-methyltransferase Ste14